VPSRRVTSSSLGMRLRPSCGITSATGAAELSDGSDLHLHVEQRIINDSIECRIAYLYMSLTQCNNVAYLNIILFPQHPNRHFCDRIPHAIGRRSSLEEGEYANTPHADHFKF
jgi:hypothetical protein